MRARDYPGSDIVIEATLDPGVNYSRYYVSYLSDGLKIYALMTVPTGEKPVTGWPVVIFNHGYIPPDVYRTTERYIAYVDQIARSGYIVFRSDYRGLKDNAWDWWSDETMGGGALGAIGSHVVDSFRWMMSAEVTKVLGMLTTHIKQRPDKNSGLRDVTTDDEAKLLFRFGDGPHTENTTGAASISVVESGKYENRLEIYGTKGALMVEETGELWRSPTGSGTWRPVQVDQDHMAQGMRPASWSRGFTAFSIAICEAMRAGKTSVKDAATFEDGYRVQLVLDAIRASSESGCWVSVSD